MQATVCPEDVIVAFFHLVGARSIVSADNKRLHDAFGDAATRIGGVFEQFRLNPRHKYSPCLQETLQGLVHGELVLREMPTWNLFGSPRAAGSYGKTRLLLLTAEERLHLEAMVESLAK